MSLLWAIFILSRRDGTGVAQALQAIKYALDGCDRRRRDGDIAPDRRWKLAGFLEANGEIAFFAPRQMHEAEVEGFVDRVRRVAKTEEFYAGFDAVAAGLLENWCGVNVEPAD